jgi:hypothetical protein
MRELEVEPEVRTVFRVPVRISVMIVNYIVTYIILTDHDKHGSSADTGLRGYAVLVTIPWILVTVMMHVY